MKRTLMFLLLGPALVVAALMMYLAGGGGSLNEFAAAFAAMLFLFSLVVSAITGVIDECLARALPITLRAPLTAIGGAIIAVGLPTALVGQIPPQNILNLLAVGGALCTGACSLLAHDYGNAHHKTTEQP